MAQIDYVLMIARLRPGAEIPLIGDGTEYEHIGVWRDKNTTKPTKVECQAEWTRYLAEKTAQEQASQQREQKLAQARQSYGAAELDLTGFGTQPALIQQLAQKIVLLEREIADLREGE